MQRIIYYLKINYQFASAPVGVGLTLDYKLFTRPPSLAFDIRGIVDP
jgi:hypothetical protein